MKLYKKYLKESTVAGAYAETGPKAMSGDDDFPTGNILMGDKYKKTGYYNRLTNFNINWVVDDGDWTWTDFEAAWGQDSIQSYSDTLRGDQCPLKDRLFKKMKTADSEPVPRHLRPLGNDLGPYHDAWGNPVDSEEDYERTGDLEDPNQDGEEETRKKRKKEGKPYKPKVMKDVIKKINGLL